VHLQSQPLQQEPHAVGEGEACGLAEFKVDLSEYERRSGGSVEHLLGRIRTLGDSAASQRAAMDVELVLQIHKSVVFDTTRSLVESRTALVKAQEALEETLAKLKKAESHACAQRMINNILEQAIEDRDVSFGLVSLLIPPRCFGFTPVT
jgi:hypothetical protein